MFFSKVKVIEIIKKMGYKNVSAETFLQELNSIKGKLFDLDVNMIF